MKGTASKPRKWPVGPRVTALLLFGALGCAAATAVAALPPVSMDATPEEKAAAVASVASDVRSEIGQLPTASRVEDFEASILFSADQSGQPAPIICSAFDQLKMEQSIPDNAKMAMDNVCRAIRNQRGTGAIPGGSGNFGVSGFSSPVISIGGGSNYTQ